MRKNINFIEVIIVFCIIVILVKGWSYQKPSKESPTPMTTPGQITTKIPTPEKAGTKITPPESNTPEDNLSEKIPTPEKVRTKITAPESDIPEDNLSADFWFKKGNALYDQEKYEEAIICYDKAIEIEPDRIN
jgi:tetratricopeptide (TPR) repeat protein